ncbi:SMI1/KNR4 family protein [Capnocytophaga leadbetteri]|uniref:SMI1/KNR4 family protein n=1 Tax=Capnocytophaga leadbetteri TaxID=327575 RepID=UPI0026EF86EB|nr:SMI1/KNR4 family protein [Capnocytophaga leadbetteri]
MNWGTSSKLAPAGGWREKKPKNITQRKKIVMVNELELNKTMPDITLSDISSFEKGIHYNLPNDFICFYLKQNGGYPTFNNIYVEEIDSVVKVKIFYSFLYRNFSGWTIESLYTFFVEEKSFLPSHFFPFASDMGDNLFCVNLKTQEVILVLLDIGEFDEEEVIHISSSFDEFLSMFA